MLFKFSKKVFEDQEKDWCLCYLDKDDKGKGVILTTKAKVQKYLKNGKLDITEIKHISWRGDKTEKELKMGPFCEDDAWEDSLGDYILIEPVRDGKVAVNRKPSDDEKLVALMEKLCSKEEACFYLTDTELEKALKEGDLGGTELASEDNENIAPMLRHFEVKNK